MFNAVAPAPNPLPADKPPIKDDDDPMAEHYPPAPTGDPPPDLYSTPSGEPPAHQYPLPQEKYPPAPTGDLHPDLYSTPAEQPPQHRYPELLDHYPRPHKFGHFEVPPQQQVVVVNAPVPVRPQNYLVLSILTCIFCNAICGIVAIVFSVMSSSAADSGNIPTARSHGKAAMISSIVGIASGVLLFIVIPIIWFAALNI